MADFPRQSDLFRVARDELLSKSKSITKDAVEREGTDANILVNTAVAAADEVVARLIDVAAGVFLDSAVGTALDRYAFDRYGLTRKPAAVAQGSVTFSIAGFGSPFTVLDGTVVQTTDGIQFITVGDQLFPAGTQLTLIVPIRSILAGANQQVAANTITAIISTIPGQPATLTVNNPLATAGADDDEEDESLRDRCRRFFVTARRGTLDAIVAGALATAGVTKATAFEVLDGQGRPSRTVLLVVTDSFTDSLATLSTNPASYATQSQQLTAAVFSNLDEYRAAGVYVQVMVAQVVMQAIQLNLTFAAGFDASGVAQLVRAAVVNYINSLSPGQTLVINAASKLSTSYPNGVAGQDLQSAIAVVPGLVLTGNEIQSPTGSVVPKALQVLRTTMALVSALAAQGQTPLLVGTTPDLYTRTSF